MIDRWVGLVAAMCSLLIKLALTPAAGGLPGQNYLFYNGEEQEQEAAEFYFLLCEILTLEVIQVSEMSLCCVFYCFYQSHTQTHTNVEM